MSTTTSATAEPRVLSPAQIKGRQRTAFQRALASELWKSVVQFADGEYGCASSDGTATYLVSLADPEREGRPSCSCQAGYHDVPCKHLAAVLVATLILGHVPESWQGALLP